MEILITNAGKEPIEIEADSWDLQEFADASRAANFSIKCSRKTPVQRWAHVVATEGNDVLFRGYVASPKIKNINTRELVCKGEEHLLLRRFTGRFSYQASARVLDHVFQSDAPSQTADVYGVTGNVGMLFMANSLIKRHGNSLITGQGDPALDWYAVGVDWIYMLTGLGLDSRIGSADIYAEGLLLPRQNTYADLQATAVSCYSDDNDLYVRLDDADYNIGFGPRYCMFAENAYDTYIRKGNIDLPSTVLTGNLQLNFTRILDILIDFAEFYGLNPRFRRGKTCTYFDALDTPVESEFILPEENIAKISQQYNEDSKVHALIGLGTGSQDVQHVYTPADHAWKGIWIEDTLDVEDGFLDTLGILKPLVNAEYAFRQEDEKFSITPSPDWGHKPRPYSMVRLKLDGEAERLLQVMSTKLDDAGNCEMEIGGRDSDILDSFNGRDSLDRVYLEDYMTEYGEAVSMSGEDFILGDTTHGSCTGASGTVTIPAAVYEADWSHRVTLDISTDTNAAPVSCIMIVQVNGTSNFLCQPRHVLLGEAVTGLDITRFCNYGTASTIAVWIKKNGEWTGASCAAHPKFDLNVTVRCWKRTIAGSNTKRGMNKKTIVFAKWKQVKGKVTRWMKKAA